MKKRILVVDDDEFIVKFVGSLLGRLDYDYCGHVSSGQEVFPAIKEKDPNLILMDIRLDGTMNGFDVARHLFEKNIRIPIIYISSDINPERIEKSKLPNSYGYLLKPFNEYVFYSMIETTFCRFYSEQKLIEHEKKLKAINEELESTNEELRKTKRELLENQLELKAKTELLSETGKIAKIGGFELELEHSKVRVTDEIYRIFEYDCKKNPIKENLKKYFPADSFSKLQKLIKKSIKFGNPFDDDFKFRTAKGNQKNVRIKGECVFEDDKITKIKGIFQDITEKMKIEAEKQEILYKLKRSNNELSEFAYIVSHDLRNPLNTIIGGLEIIKLEIEKYNEEDKELINMIYGRSKFMLSLINDLLELAKLDNKKREYTSFKFEDIITHTKNNLYKKIVERDVLITIENPPFIKADWNLIIILMQNIIENAIKYNIQRPIIQVSSEESEEYFTFYIKDNGIGIPESAKETIFDIFTRFNKKFDGTGIGLATCKKIVELHNGKIYIENNESGIGSTIYFTLPKI